ncbi:MAG: PrsW family glutamic-type intramembrane protease [Candidatus Liptonbacteria bacterium]|nr:PrsW family glutamic-type intramembrane protease [Candidatus Liptonbacteria bacterium]
MNLLIIILGLLPGFTWLLFYLQEDIHPEPKKMIAKVFFAGALSAIAALLVQLLISCAFVYHFGNCSKTLAEKISLISPALMLAFVAVEEIAKFAAAYFIIAKSKYFDEPVDAMVYMAVAALGFATVENLGALSGQGTPVLLSGIFEIATFRFVGTTLLHTLTSSIAGYFWALGIRNFKSKKFIVYGLILATILHTAFNYLILTTVNLLYPIVFVTIVGLFMLGDFDKLKRKQI